MENDRKPIDLQDSWESIQRNRQQVAAELLRMASSFPRSDRQQLRALGRWFQRPAEWDDALKLPDVLALCLPLADACRPQATLEPEMTKSGNRAGSDSSTTYQDDGIAENAQIAQAVRVGFCSLGRDVSVTKRVFRILKYPLIVALGFLAMLVAFSFLLVPLFEELFADFGIELPANTKLMFWFTGEVRRVGWMYGWAALVFGFLLWLFSRPGTGSSSARQSWLDQTLMGSRNTLAGWAWHISLLLEAGLTQDQAIAWATQAAGKKWLRKSFASWETDQHPDQSTQFLQPEIPLGPRFSLLNTTLHLPDSQGKIELLRQSATYYWDRGSGWGDWWVHWLAALMVWGMGLIVVFVVLTLFMPLLGSISGLTGF